MTTPRVSIITPCYNAAPFIAETIASVQAQQMTDWEMLIADDGSTDGSAAIVSAIAAQDPRVQLITGPRAGLPSVMRNRALAASRAQWIAFLDADDLWEPQKLTRQIPAPGSEPAWGFSNIRHFGGGALLPDGFRFPSDWRPARPFFPALLTGEGIPFLSVFAHRDLLTKAAGGDIARAFDQHPNFRGVEDWDLTLRLARLAEPVYTPEVLAGYREHAGGISKDPEGQYRRAMGVLGKVAAAAGADAALLRGAFRLHRSKRALGRLLAGQPGWRRELLINTALPPRNARDLYLTLVGLAPDGLARRLYAAGIARARNR